MLEIRKIVCGCGSVSVNVCPQHWKRNANTPEPKQAHPNPFSSVFPSRKAGQSINSYKLVTVQK